MKPADASVLVNGKTASIALPRTIAQFLDDAGWKVTHVVVEYNGSVIPRQELQDVHLSEGDRLEVIVPVAGG